MPLFPIDYCRFLKSLLSHSKYFVKEETTLCGYKVKNKIFIPQITNVFFGEKVLMGLLMRYYLESQSRPLVGVDMFGDYLKRRIRSFGIKHIPAYGICNKVGNLQSDDVVGFVL